MVGKKWLFIVIILSILSLVLVGLVFTYFRNREITRNKPKEEIILTLPKELSTDFDPTINTPIFKIVSANQNENTLDLEMIFPENKILKVITSLVTCQDSDIQILKNGSKIGIGIVSLFTNINENSKDQMTFSGYCSDATCKEINKQCLLNTQ